VTYTGPRRMMLVTSALLFELFELYDRAIGESRPPTFDARLGDAEELHDEVARLRPRVYEAVEQMRKASEFRE